MTTVFSLIEYHKNAQGFKVSMCQQRMQSTNAADAYFLELEVSAFVFMTFRHHFIGYYSMDFHCFF